MRGVSWRARPSIPTNSPEPCDPLGLAKVMLAGLQQEIHADRDGRLEAGEATTADSCQVGRPKSRDASLQGFRVTVEVDYLRMADGPEVLYGSGTREP
jgi:hypothetical protein